MKKQAPKTKALRATPQMMLRIELIERIQAVRSQLGLLAGQVEQFKVDLLSVKRDYEQHIARLYRRMDSLDGQIQHAKRLRALLRKGYSYAQAQRMVSPDLPPPGAEADAETPPPPPPSAGMDRGEGEIKNLWRSLVCRFHPDLSTSPQEKKQREEIMKQINAAYMEGDVEVLRRIQLERLDCLEEKASVSALRERLHTLEAAVSRLTRQMGQLQKSIWSVWKRKIEAARAQKRNLFRELTARLRLRILKKERQLSNLTRGYETQKSAADG